MEQKSVFTSKTFWVNVIALAGTLSASFWGYEISPELALSILSVVNLILRLVTKSPIVWKK